jgi:hypothetical protein
MARVSERDHVERLAARLLQEQGSPQKAVAMANLLAKAAAGRGQEIWRMVAAQLSATEPELQQVEQP